VQYDLLKMKGYLGKEKRFFDKPYGPVFLQGGMLGEELVRKQ
jgi:hypothetical protein